MYGIVSVNVKHNVTENRLYSSFCFQLNPKHSVHLKRDMLQIVANFLCKKVSFQNLKNWYQCCLCDVECAINQSANWSMNVWRCILHKLSVQYVLVATSSKTSECTNVTHSKWKKVTLCSNGSDTGTSHPVLWLIVPH